jgi:TusA-related sulfurtransferase
VGLEPVYTRIGNSATDALERRLALEDIEDGMIARILLDDDELVKNVPRSFKAEGHKLLGFTQSNEGHYILELRKAGE